MSDINDSEEKALETPSSEESGLGGCNGEEGGSEQEAALVVPPDGGWGWVIVAASFLCNVIVDGIIFSTTFSVADIMEKFKTSDSQSRVVTSTQQGLYLMAGPVVSAIANKFGFRAVTIAGSILAAAGFALSYFATNIEVLYLTFGVMTGIGFCMNYLPAVITVGFYFEKWRALATGIALCGSGVGTMVLGRVMKQLVEDYGWQNTTLIQAGITLVCVLCGALFRPIKPISVKIKDDESSNSGKAANKTERDEFISKLKQKLDSGISEKLQNSSSAHTWMGVENNTKYPTVAEVFSQKTERRRSINAIILKDHLMKQKTDIDSAPLAEGEENDKVDNITPLIKRRPGLEPVVRPFYRDDILYPGSLHRLPIYKSQTSLGYHFSVTHLPTSNDVKEERTGKCSLCPEAIRRTLYTMLDLELLRSPTFVILALSGLFMMMGFFVPYAYVVERYEKYYEDVKSKTEKNDETKWLLSTIGLANVIGRLVCGGITSMEKVSTLWVNNIAIFIGGLATIFSGLYMVVWYQHAYCVVFGLAAACFASLRSILVVDYMGLEKLTNSFGLLLLFQGVGALIGTPIAGALLGIDKDYNAPYYFAGTFFILSAVICFPLDYVWEWEKSNAKKKPHMPV